MLKAEKAEGDRFDRAAFVEEFSQSWPEQLTVDKRPARLATGGGHPPGKGSSEIRARTQRIAELRAKQHPTMADAAELSALLQQQRRVRGGNR